MNPALLRSQFADLEEPKPDEDVITFELGRTPQELVKGNQRETASGQQGLDRGSVFERGKEQLLTSTRVFY